MKNSTSYLVLALIALFLFGSCGAAHKKNRYIKRNYKEMKKSFPAAAVSLVHDSIKVIFPNNIVFDVSSATVKPTFDNKLDRFVQILSKFNRTNLLINGYTDNSGSEETNLKLSLKRATNVKDQLNLKNINSNRLFTWGLGEKNPISTNDTEVGRGKNRRVEFIVLYKP